MNDFTYVERIPTVDEYCKLRNAVGWGNLDTRTTKVALRNSLFSVCVVYKGETIGCGRVIEDQGLYYYLQDYCIAGISGKRNRKKHNGFNYDFFEF